MIKNSAMRSIRRQRTRSSRRRRRRRKEKKLLLAKKKINLSTTLLNLPLLPILVPDTLIYLWLNLFKHLSRRCTGSSSSGRLKTTRMDPTPVTPLLNPRTAKTLVVPTDHPRRTRLQTRLHPGVGTCSRALMPLKL